MVQLVRNNQAPFIHQRRNNSRIRRKAHGTDQGILLAKELRNELFRLGVQVERTALKAGTTSSKSIALDALEDGISTPALPLRETEVIVRREVKPARAGASELECRVMIVRFAVEQRDGTTWHARCGPRETIINALLQPPGVE